MKVRIALFVLLAAGALADIPDISKRPVGRPGSTAGGALPLNLETSGAITAPARAAGAQDAMLRGDVPRASLRPQKRSRAVRRLIRQQQKLRAKGAVCGDPDIQGDVVGRVPGRISGCGVSEAVQVRSVSDVALSQRSVMDCGTARALKAWVDQVARAGMTFRYSETGPVGLLEGKRAIVIIASGGTEAGSEIDFATGYQRHVLSFIGITDVEFVTADRLMIDAEGTMKAANDQVAALTVAA